MSGVRINHLEDRADALELRVEALARELAEAKVKIEEIELDTKERYQDLCVSIDRVRGAING